MTFGEMAEIIQAVVEKLGSQKNFPIKFVCASGYGDEWGEEYINFTVVDNELRSRLWAKDEFSEDQKTDYAKWTLLKLHVPKDYFNKEDDTEDTDYKRKFSGKWENFTLKQKASIRVCNLLFETYPFWRKITVEKHPELK